MSAPDALRLAAEHILTDVLTGNTALRHPNKPEAAILPAWFNPAGHNPQMVDALTRTAQVTAEAIVNTLLTKLNAELISATELQQLGAQAANHQHRIIDITCRHGPLLRIALPAGSDTTNIDCEHLRRNLTECETG